MIKVNQVLGLPPIVSTRRVEPITSKEDEVPELAKLDSKKEVENLRI